MMDMIVSNAGLIGLIFFFVLFLGVAFWVYRPGARQAYQKQAYIPLNEEQ